MSTTILNEIFVAQNLVVFPALNSSSIMNSLHKIHLYGIPTLSDSSPQIGIVPSLINPRHNIIHTLVFHTNNFNP